MGATLKQVVTIAIDRVYRETLIRSETRGRCNAPRLVTQAK
jgi:hypothetical protein